MGAVEPAANVAFFHPAHKNYRFLFLIMLCFMTFGSYWCYDIPAALQQQLKDHYVLSSSQYSLFYSLYNFMNIGIVLFGGYFIDVIGLRLGSVLFCFLIAVGQLVFSFGATLHDPHHAYYVMLAGRVIFSLGGESLSVAQSTFTSKWFKGNELAFAFGITLSFSRVGSFANLNVTPILQQHWGLTGAIWFGTLTCMISVALTLFAAYSDRVRDNHFKAIANESADGANQEKPTVPFRISDIKHFPLSLWLIYFICVCYYVPIFTTVSIGGTNYVQSIFTNMSDNVANRYLSIPYMMSAVLAPICGFVVDRAGRKPMFLSLASALMGGTFAIFIFGLHYVHEIYMIIIGVVILGFSYSLCAAALWPGVPLLVAEERVGTAYAIMNSIQNGGLAIAGVVTGALGCPKNVNQLYCTRPPILFLAFVSIASLGLSVLLTLWDLGHGSILARKSERVEEVVVDDKSPLSPLLGDEKDPLLGNRKSSVNA